MNDFTHGFLWGLGFGAPIGAALLGLVVHYA